MSRTRTLVSTRIGLTFAASLALFGGCGGGNPEIDNAVLIRNEPAKSEGATSPKPTGETPPPKDAEKP